MKIELLLHHVAQELRAPAGEPPFFGWMHGPSGGGTGDKRKKPAPAEEKKKAPPKKTPQSKQVSNYVLRKESWGGVLHCANTQNVYAADAEAFEILWRLHQEERLADLMESFSSDGRGVDSLEELISYHVIA
uniref:hypothetical protein n=1 Tax=Polaromonas sp. W10N TaxID=1840301 RepID=UPI0015E7FFFA|nr:hypothetical protein [Polaromonas sp. W10N]